MKKLLVLLAAMALVVFGAGLALAGEWHTGTNNLCTDCHTMHFSMAHDWSGGTPVSATPMANGNWLSATGPNDFLLKAPANQLCLACHDGQTFAPDVMGANTNASPTQGRHAGALNMLGLGDPGYEVWKGHTLEGTTTPPGWDNGVAVGLTAAPYTPSNGLECISCHTQHGSAGIYRNLGPRGLSANRPSYVLGTTNDTTKDVWINIASPYSVNSGSAATFNPFYDSANVSYNRNDRTVGTSTTSNGLDTMCGACHGNFHGGAGATDPTRGSATPAALDGFARHPTSQVTIGAAGGQGFGGHSSLSRYVSGTTGTTGRPSNTKVKVYANDRAAYTDASPGCVSCHKAHGNKNPFGLIFLYANAATVGEEGGYGAGQTEVTNGYQVGYRNLCGQCHGQGN